MISQFRRWFATGRHDQSTAIMLYIFPAALLVDLVVSRATSALHRRSTAIPSPISFPPAQNWEGIAGQWNTFALRVGTPAQVVRVDISTTSQQVWVIAPKACIYSHTGAEKAACGDSRGNLYYSNQSSTYQDQGLWDLYIESNLNYTGNAEYGYDVIGMGYDGEGGPTLKSQLLGALAKEDFWFGHFGLHPKSTNFSDFNTPIPSFMSSLRTQNLIPSVSWGFTQGAPYRMFARWSSGLPQLTTPGYSKVYASLTLGGYDSSRFVPNQVTIPLAADNERDILININSITTDVSQSSTTLLPNPIYAFVDSTVPELWLPLSVCQLFEQTFNLTYDPTTQLYLLSTAQHQALLASNPNITFTISHNPGDGSSVSISFPYAAFDLMAKSPYQGLRSDASYFPLRRAANDTQYTLGKTFLQEAYLIVDWERGNFSLSQCLWQPNSQANIVTISSKNSTTSGSSSAHSGVTGLGTGGIAGLIVGIVAVVVLATVLGFCFFHRRRRRPQEGEKDGSAG
jgi:hypothetical protein